jgi:hypothetical protein
MTTTVRPERLLVVADHSPGVHQTDSERWTLWASLERLAMFGYAYFASVDVFTIGLHLPALTPRQATALHPPQSRATRRGPTELSSLP